jgi:hypothetical protein
MPAPSGHLQWRSERESISKPCAAAILRMCRGFRRRANLDSPYGNGVDLESGTPLSTTRAMKSCCRSNRQLGRRGLRIPRSDRVVRGDRRWAITSTSFGLVAEPFTGTWSFFCAAIGISELQFRLVYWSAYDPRDHIARAPRASIA